jgi:serine O-acetyltransferase
VSVGNDQPRPDVSAAGPGAGGAASPSAAATRPRTTPGGLLSTVRADLRQKALWLYESDGWRAKVKVLLTDGTFAMLLYRLMQWSGRYRLVPLEMIFNKLNSALCHCIIGRGAHFGPGLVLIHSTGVVINGSVYGGSGVHIEHQVTIGAERRASPVIGDGVFIGAGAKVIGAVTIGDGARVGANAVVVHDVPPHCTVVGIPAKVVRRRDPAGTAGDDGAAAAGTPSGG